MKALFTDTYYFVALINPKDDYHAVAHEYTGKFGGRIVTTAWVLTELGNTLSHPLANRPFFCRSSTTCGRTSACSSCLLPRNSSSGG